MTGYEILNPDVPKEEAEESQFPNPPSEVITAFVVYMDKNGRWSADSRLEKFDDVTIERAPDSLDVVHGAHATYVDTSVLRDQQVNVPVIVNSTIQGVVNAQLEIGKKMAEQQRNAQILQAVKSHSG